MLIKSYVFSPYRWIITDFPGNRRALLNYFITRLVTMDYLFPWFAYLSFIYTPTNTFIVIFNQNGDLCHTILHQFVVISESLKINCCYRAKVLEWSGSSFCLARELGSIIWNVKNYLILHYHVFVLIFIKRNGFLRMRKISYLP